MNYIQTKALFPELYKQISPPKTIKHQPYKQITIAYRLVIGVYIDFEGLIFILVEEEVFFRRIVGPYIFNALVSIAFILHLL